MYVPYQKQRFPRKKPYSLPWNNFAQPSNQLTPFRWKEGQSKTRKLARKASYGTLARLMEYPYTRDENFANSQKAELKNSILSAKNAGLRRLAQTSAKLGTTYTGIGQDQQRKIDADSEMKLGGGINAMNRAFVDKNRNDLLQALRLGLGQANTDRNYKIMRDQQVNQVMASYAGKPPKVDGGGKVICSELYRQGLLPEEVRDADELFGEYIKITNPVLIIGYWTWAIPAVELMKKSKVLTWIASKIATSWATEIAYQLGTVRKGSIFGRIVSIIGSVACYHIGLYKTKRGKSNGQCNN